MFTKQQTQYILGVIMTWFYICCLASTAHSACTISNVQTHNFGTYIWGSAVQLTTTSTITVNCDTTDQFILGLDGGLNPTCYRNMAGPVSDIMNYTLTKTNSAADLWGDTTSFWLREYAASPGDNNYTVFGWTIGEPAEEGFYQDTVTVQLRRMSDEAVVDSNTLTVDMDVLGSCYIDRVQTMDFGSFPSDTSGDLTATGSIEFTCTPDISYKIGMDDGLDFTGPLARRMLFDDTTPDYLPYGIFQDASHTTPWGIIGSGNEFSGTGAPGEVNTVDIFGLVQGSETYVKPGSYTDTVAVTIEW